MGYKGCLGSVEFSEDWRTLDYEISEISRKSKRTYWKGLNTNGK